MEIQQTFEGEDQLGRTLSKPVSTSCLLCGSTSLDVHGQRGHVKSDWHKYNLKQKLRGNKPVSEIDFERLVEDLEESISGEDSSESDDNEEKDSILTALLKKQANINQDEQENEDFTLGRRKRGAGKTPYVWFSSSLLPSNMSLGIYRALFTKAEQEQGSDLVDAVCKKQLKPVASKTHSSGSNGVPLPSTMTSPQVFLCMVGGGHFAGMVVSLAPKLGKTSAGIEERQAIVVAHKTFHRYTTRRKQGGAQSSNDSAKGAAHSAGASIRRHNEAALEGDIRSLLAEWRQLINESQLCFIRATGSANRRILFGPYEGQVLRPNDSRNRGFPFSTRRATQAELMRAFVELTRLKVSEVDEAALAGTAAAMENEKAAKTRASNVAPTKSSSSSVFNPSKQEEEALLHTTQLQALIRRSKAPALLSYLSSNSLSPDFPFYPVSTQTNHHAPTPLHLAASSNSSVVVLALLTKGGANPELLNQEAKTAFDLAGDRATRDAFRVARGEVGEERWDWGKAHITSAISREEAERRRAKEKTQDEDKERERRREEEERLKGVGVGTGEAAGKKSSGKALGAMEKTGAEKREEEGRGLTPEMRMRLERERRARAAEERIKRMGGGR